MYLFVHILKACQKHESYAVDLPCRDRRCTLRRARTLAQDFPIVWFHTHHRAGFRAHHLHTYNASLLLYCCTAVHTCKMIKQLVQTRVATVGECSWISAFHESTIFELTKPYLTGAARIAMLPTIPQEKALLLRRPRATNERLRDRDHKRP